MKPEFNDNFKKTLTNFFGAFRSLAVQVISLSQVLRITRHRAGKETLFRRCGWRVEALF